MKIRIIGAPVDVSAEAKRLISTYRVRRKSKTMPCKSAPGEVRLYLELHPAGQPIVALSSGDAAHALAALHALALQQPGGLDRHSAEVAERIGAALVAAGEQPDTVHPHPDSFSASPR